jgi:PAS domain S-box-containing protein
MSDEGHIDSTGASLEQVLITEELQRRPSRPPNYEGEAKALAALAQEIAAGPETILQKLVDHALALCRADSSCVCILEPDGPCGGICRWHAVAGRFAQSRGAALPPDRSLCGAAIQRNAVLLFRYPERHFSLPSGIETPIAEALVVPFHAAGQPVGTVWVIADSPERKFDAEDARLLTSLSRFASAAYQMTASLRAEKAARAETEGQTHELSRAVAELRKNHEVLRLVHQTGKVGHWEWNALTDENRWSPENETIFGLKPGTFGGTYQAWAKLVHPDDLPKAEEVARRALETGHYFTEFRVVWPDGSVHWLESRATVFRDEHDKAVRMSGVNMDITERKRQEGALRQSEENLRRELDAARHLQQVSMQLIQASGIQPLYEQILDAAVGIMRSDFASMQLFYPERGTAGELRLLGHRGFTAEAAKFFEWVSPSSSCSCGMALNTRQRVIVPDVRRVLVGDYLEAHLRTGIRAAQSTPLLSRTDGAMLGMITTHWREPHEPKAAELRLLDVLARQAADLIEGKRIVEALHESDRRKDEFLAMLGHELRNPLAPLWSVIETLQRQKLNENELQRAYAVMQRQVMHLRRLVDDLLDVSRITRGTIELQKETVDLARIVDEAVEMAAPVIEDRGHNLTISEPRKTPSVEGDEARLTQVIFNLLNNAAKYTDPGGRINLTLEREDHQAVVRVRDNGSGIAADLMPKLFDLFTQGKRRPNRAQNGLGVGLTLVKQLVEMHGGTVQALSEGPGKGSEFVVRLPALVADGEKKPPPPRPALAPSAVAAATAACVLIVDDDLDVAESLAMLLEGLAQDIRMAHSGPEALEVARACLPNIILCDIGMPGMDGYEVARRLRQEPHLEKVLLAAVSGYGQEEDRRRSQEAGFDRHLVKPIGLATLEELLGSIDQKKELTLREA